MNPVQHQALRARHLAPVDRGASTLEWEVAFHPVDYVGIVGDHGCLVAGARQEFIQVSDTVLHASHLLNRFMISSTRFRSPSNSMVPFVLPFHQLMCAPWCSSYSTRNP